MRVITILRYQFRYDFFVFITIDSGKYNYLLGEVSCSKNKNYMYDYFILLIYNI